MDPGRVSLLVAILEKRVGLGMGGQDLFVNVAGGVRLTEPAAGPGDFPGRSFFLSGSAGARGYPDLR